MTCGAGYYGIGILTTVLGLITLILLNRIEKIYPKDTYRNLQITAEFGTDYQKLIDTIKRKGIKILIFEEEKNYAEKEIVINMIIRLHSKGVTDRISQKIIEDLENGGFVLHSVKWKKE